MIRPAVPKEEEMNRLLVFKVLIPVLVLTAAFAANSTISKAPPTESVDPKPGSSSEKPTPPGFPHHAEVEYERSVIRIPIMMTGDKKPREVVELTAFMKLERGVPVRNTIGYRQFEFTIKEWELFGYSEFMQAHLSFAASKDVVQPKSLAVSLQKEADFPALIVYNAIYDIYIDGVKILSQTPGVAMARGVVEIPPRNITVAFQKPFTISHLGHKLIRPGEKHEYCDPYSFVCYEAGPGTCEDMETITAEEFAAGLREAKAIRQRLATLKPKPTQKQGEAKKVGR
jgi:hypothetical protein